MVVKRTFLVLILMSLALILSAQSIKVMSSVNKNTITLGDQLQLILKINSDAVLRISEPSPPQVEGLSFRNMLSSSSSSTSFVNGKLSTEHSRTYTYVYTPVRTGKFTIPGFSLQIGSTNYSTRPIAIEVVDSPRGSIPQYGTDPTPWFEEFDPYFRGAGTSLILCQPSSQTVYRGEPAVVSYFLYTNQSVRSFNLESEKDFEGYGKAIYEQPTVLDFEDTTFNGERFRRSLLKRVVLFPQVTGRLQVPTMTGTMRLFDYGYLNRSVVSNDAYIEVQPLPSGSPEGFTGAVGRFELSDSYLGDQINLGEAITYTLKISGRGNFSQFTSPAYPKTAKFQVSEATTQDRLGTPIEGTRLIYFTIVPQETGEFELKGLVFSWFDTATGTYQSFTSTPQVVKVKPANVLSYFSNILQGDKPKTLNPLLARTVYPRHLFPAARLWYWLVVAVLLLSLPVSAIVAYERRLRQKDPATYAQKHASRILEKYLKAATEAAKELSPEFYVQAEKGLQDYLEKKFRISKHLSTAELLDQLRQQKLPQDLLNKLTEFLTACQKARYMPGGIETTVLADDLALLKRLVAGFGRLRTVGSFTRYNEHPNRPPVQTPQAPER